MITCWPSWRSMQTISKLWLLSELSSCRKKNRWLKISCTECYQGDTHVIENGCYHACFTEVMIKIFVIDCLNWRLSVVIYYYCTKYNLFIEMSFLTMIDYHKYKYVTMTVNVFVEWKPVFPDWSHTLLVKLKLKPGNILFVKSSHMYIFINPKVNAFLY